MEDIDSKVAQFVRSMILVLFFTLLVKGQVIFYCCGILWYGNC